MDEDETSQAKEHVVWEAQNGPQKKLISCPVFEVFFGGARGGGKTDGMLGEWLSHQDAYGEHASGLMVRRTLRDLEDTIKRSKQIYFPLGAVFKEQDKVWKFPNKSELKFRYLEHDSDADHYQGHSYSRVYIEEIGQFSSPVPVFKLMATLRSGAGVPCGFRATGNPGGPGHHWVKERYITPSPLGWKVLKSAFSNPWDGTSIERERIFIPSNLRDNKYLGNDYIANLYMAGNATLVRAWLEGDWNVVQGAFFPEWSTLEHVITPFEIPSYWTRFRSGDWGTAHPFSIGWWAVASDDFRLPSTGNLIPRGGLIRYREWYGASAPNVGIGLTAEEVARGIVEREPTKPEYAVLDPRCFANDGGPSIAERMYQCNGTLWRPADNARVARAGAMGGWDQVRARLIGTAQRRSTGEVDFSTGRPAIYFFINCSDAIRTLPTLPHDQHKPEDVDTNSEDHVADEIRYACMSRPYISARPDALASKVLQIGNAAGTSLSLSDLFEENERRQSNRKNERIK